MFDERPQRTNAIYAISNEPMSAEEWKKKQYVSDPRGQLHLHYLGGPLGRKSSHCPLVACADVIGSVLQIF